MTEIPTLETDVLVCGAGIAGLTAARHRPGGWRSSRGAGKRTGNRRIGRPLRWNRLDGAGPGRLVVRPARRVTRR